MQVIKSIRKKNTKKFINLINKNIFDLNDLELEECSSINPSYMNNDDLYSMLGRICSDIFIKFIDNQQGIFHDNLQACYDEHVHEYGYDYEPGEICMKKLFHGIFNNNITNIVTMIEYMEKNMSQIVFLANKNVLYNIILPDVRDNPLYLNGMDVDTFDNMCREKYKSDYKWSEDKKRMPVYKLILEYTYERAKENTDIREEYDVIKNILNNYIFSDGVKIIMSYIQWGDKISLFSAYFSHAMNDIHP